MTAELGGFTGIVAPDDETVRFLRERRGVDFALEPWMRSDAGARYADTIARRLHARCRRWWRARAIPATACRWPSWPSACAIDIAYGGSCTAGKREDFDHYHAVLAWAAERGLRVPPGVTLYLQFGTTAVRDYCIARGYLDGLRAGRRAHPAAVVRRLRQLRARARRPTAEQVTVSAINRNFPGRSGPGQVWLASPPTVAASAIAGRLTSFEELQRRAASPR